MALIKKKDKDFEARERLSKNIHVAIKYISKTIVAFNNIIKDKEQEKYSQVKAASMVVALDALIKLAGSEDTQPLAYAAAMIQEIASNKEINKELSNQSKEEDQLLKGKNVVTNVPKTIH